MSNLRKARKHPGLQMWIERTGWDKISTTVVTIIEIQCGIERQRPSDPVYAGATQAWLNRFLEIGAPQVHALTASAGLLLACMHETAALRSFVVSDPKQKQPKTAADLAIAAITITEGAILATGNHRHFEAIDAHFPLPGLYNPFEDSWSRKPAV